MWCVSNSVTGIWYLVSCRYLVYPALLSCTNSRKWYKRVSVTYTLLHGTVCVLAAPSGHGGGASTCGAVPSLCRFGLCILPFLGWLGIYRQGVLALWGPN